MAHDVFISYATEDKAVANAICAKLEEHGIRCWIAPRDTHLGNWTPQIMDAITEAEIVVFVFSAYSNHSKHVHREVMNAFELGKTVVPFRIDDIEPAKDLGYFIRGVHWLDAITPPVEEHISKLVADLSAWKQRSSGNTELPLVSRDTDIGAVVAELRGELDRLRREKTESEATTQKLRRRYFFGAAAAAAAGAVVLSAFVSVASWQKNERPTKSGAAATITASSGTTDTAGHEPYAQAPDDGNAESAGRDPLTDKRPVLEPERNGSTQ